MKKLFLLIISISLFTSTGAQTNLITNGSFENDFWPSRQPGTYVFARDIAYSEPARVAEYFNSQTEKYWPKIDDTTQPQFDTEFGVWYMRNSGTYNYIRLYVDALKPTPPQGAKCLTFHNTKYYGTASRNQQALTPFQHVGFQKVSLDNTKKYQLSFSYMKMDSLIGAANGTANYKTQNYASRFVAGIVCSTEPTTPLDYSFIVNIPIPAAGDELWKDTVIVFDLPALIEQNGVRNFTSSAILFGLQTQEDVESTSTYTMMPGQMSIDNVVLKEYIVSHVDNIDLSVNYKIVNKDLIVNDGVNSVRIYDMLGSLVCQKSGIEPSQTVYTFKTAGTYILKLNDKTTKVVVY